MLQFYACAHKQRLCDAQFDDAVTPQTSLGAATGAIASCACVGMKPGEMGVHPQIRQGCDAVNQLYKFSP